MASPDLVIDSYKLDTEFLDGHVQHATSQDKRRREVKKWSREKKLGRGASGTVFLEKSEQGEYRAVKVISKGSTTEVRYRRELMAMGILANHDTLFVQLFGWYESGDYVYIAMEYANYDLREYLTVERSENDAKQITRQLLKGLVILHREGFAHRDLKPENIFVFSEFPIQVKIGDFGQSKLARDDTVLRTVVYTIGYLSPEMGPASNDNSSEYTNAVDIWAVGCIAHEVLTGVLPFRDYSALYGYCSCAVFPLNYMLRKNITPEGMQIVESMLAVSPQRRISPKKALDSGWLQPEDGRPKSRSTEEEGQEEWPAEEKGGQGGLETGEGLAGLASPELPACPGAEVATEDSLPGSKEGFRNHMAIAVDAKHQRSPEVLLPQLSQRLKVGILGGGHLTRRSQKWPSLLIGCSLCAILVGVTVRVGEQAAIDSINLPGALAPIQTAKITGAPGAILELPLVFRDKEYQTPKRSADILRNLSKLRPTCDKNSATMLSTGGSTEAQPEQALREQRQHKQEQPEELLRDEQVLKDAGYYPLDDQNSATAALSHAVRRRKNLRVIRSLLAKGANPVSLIVQPEYSNRSALHVAAEVGYTSAINIMAEIKGIPTELNFPDSYGDTPLSWAASNGHEGALIALLEKGVKPDTTNKFGRTPLILAAFFDNAVGVRRLLAKGANLDITDNDIDTALTLASRKGYEAVVRLLLANGAKHDIRNINGETALSLAKKSGHDTVAGLLLGHMASSEPQAVGNTLGTLMTEELKFVNIAVVSQNAQALQMLQHLQQSMNQVQYQLKGAETRATAIDTRLTAIDTRMTTIDTRVKDI